MSKKKTTTESHVMRYETRADAWVCTCGYTVNEDWPHIIQLYEQHKKDVGA